MARPNDCIGLLVQCPACESIHVEVSGPNVELACLRCHATFDRASALVTDITQRKHRDKGSREARLLRALNVACDVIEKQNAALTRRIEGDGEVTTETDGAGDLVIKARNFVDNIEMCGWRISDES